MIKISKRNPDLDKLEVFLTQEFESNNEVTFTGDKAVVIAKLAKPLGYNAQLGWKNMIVTISRKPISAIH